ncbi:MAG: pentapeptide repeat-containing protein [Spirulinaceae cyanobacterium SM2_1_0]|nr:pentapeptide repeat-containing protein [Spirulinaceae cyanobacterium SM2_1_0]
MKVKERARELAQLYENGIRNFGAFDLNEADLKNINLSGAVLSRANLKVANLSGADLSRADLCDASLHVARLSAANLSGANLSRARLNVANLIQADLNRAKLNDADLLHAELVRANLSRADLSGANLSHANLHEAQLYRTNLSRANLAAVNLRHCSGSEANFAEAILSSASLNRADLSGACLSEADLSRANLSLANLTGADLRGANLRWADLSGAKLHLADLSEAKLSGANLTGADLSSTNLVNTSLVHADLSRARLMRAEWSGADLTGATLTGAKLYGVARFGLKLSNLTCAWVDLSPEGDQSKVQQLPPEQLEQFFNATPPVLQLTVDAPLDLTAHVTMATLYHQIAAVCPALTRPPDLTLGARRTSLRFPVAENEHLLAIAYCALLPFADGIAVSRHLQALLQVLQGLRSDVLSARECEQVRHLGLAFEQAVESLRERRREYQTHADPAAAKFLSAPTQVNATNSRGKTIQIYQSAGFGKRRSPLQTTAAAATQIVLPAKSLLIEFVRDFFYAFATL